MSKKQLGRVVVVGTTIAVLAGGGAALAGASGDDDDVSAAPDPPNHEVTDRAVAERASAVALRETGGGTVTEVEAADDGVTGYGVEVRREDGSEVEVNVGRDFKLVSVERDD
jgi:uncharacterized membrane protein YkoI